MANNKIALETIEVESVGSVAYTGWYRILYNLLRFETRGDYEAKWE